MLRTLAAAVIFCAFAFPADAEAQTVAEPIDLFEAIDAGMLGVQVIVRDPYHGRIVLMNATELPLAIDLPDFLGARPVLAQQGFQFPGLTGQPSGGTPGQGNQAGLPQSVGGTSRSSSQSAGIFNIAPEQVRYVDLQCFCLEQGKPNPRSAVKYELVPLKEVNDDPRLPELFLAYGRDDVDRDVVQAAVWHAANDKSWSDLADLSQRIAINADRPLFSPQQLRQARQLVESIEARFAEQRSRKAKETISASKLPRL